MCRKAFNSFDNDGSGTVDVKELKTVMEAVGQHCSDAELTAMLNEVRSQHVQSSSIKMQVDEDKSGEIEFPEFLRLAERQKQAQARPDNGDTVEAFVALGGKADKSGKVLLEKLRATVKEFELTIDLETMLADMDKEGTGGIDFAEFQSLLER
eukprot:jgi/Astpho2/2937/Aster-x0120